MSEREEDGLCFLPEQQQQEGYSADRGLQEQDSQRSPLSPENHSGADEKEASARLDQSHGAGHEFLRR